MILYLAADLIWATKIKGTAEALGLGCRPVRSLEMLEARLAEQGEGDPITALIVDLECPGEALAMVARLRGPGATAGERGIRILAFGPHVAGELFKEASRLGVDRAIARGALDRGMPEILRSLAGSRE